MLGTAPLLIYNPQQDGISASQENDNLHKERSRDLKTFFRQSQSTGPITSRTRSGRDAPSVVFGFKHQRR